MQLLDTVDGSVGAGLEITAEGRRQGTRGHLMGAPFDWILATHESVCRALSPGLTSKESKDDATRRLAPNGDVKIHLLSHSRRLFGGTGPAGHKQGSVGQDGTVWGSEVVRLQRWWWWAVGLGGGAVVLRIVDAGRCAWAGGGRAGETMGTPPTTPCQVGCLKNAALLQPQCISITIYAIPL